MNFLIIIKDTSEQSKNILQIGAKVANAFSANLSIIHVGKKSKAMIEGEVSLARITMGEWNILHPGIEVLNWAYETLKEFDTIEIDPEAELKPENYVTHTKRITLSIPQSSGRDCLAHRGIVFGVYRLQTLDQRGLLPNLYRYQLQFQ